MFCNTMAHFDMSETDTTKALKDNTTLTELKLDCIFIRSIEATNIANAIAESLKKNTTLTELKLNAIGIGNEGAKLIAEALKVNSTLTLFYLEVYN